VLFINPLALAAVPAALVYAVSMHKKRIYVSAVILKVIWSYILLGALASIAARISPRYIQDNTIVLLTVMPAAFVMSAGGRAKQLCRLCITRLAARRSGRH
jgi:cytochrome c biogenesis protein CcdA